MNVSEFFQNFSKLTGRQAGVLPSGVAGPLPHALVRGLLGAGAGYLAGSVAGSVIPGVDKKRLKTTLAVGGAAAGVGSSVPDLVTSHGMFDSYPYDKSAAYKFSSTQVNLDGPLRQKVLDLAAQVPEESLTDNGREKNPHVTVLYGLHSPSPDPIRTVLTGHDSGDMTLGGLSLFTNHPDFDVIKSDVHSPKLHDLNGALRKLPNSNRFPDYHPHVTIAYVKKGTGKDFVGRMDLAGETHPVETVTMSPAGDGPTVPVRLGTRSVIEKAAFDTDSPDDTNVLGFGAVSGAPIHVGTAAQMLLADRVMNPLQRAMTMQVLESASSNRAHITTADLVRAGVGAGLGYVQGNLVGRFMGAVFGILPSMQQRVSQLGALGGLLSAAGILE